MTSSPAASHPPASAARRPAVRRFGRLELLQLLGKSARTMSWLARDPRLGHELLVHLPRRQPESGAEESDWNQRVRQGARLQHPGLAHVVEIDTQDRWPYIAVDRELGETLAERLQRTQPTVTESVDWVCQLLEALAFAHEAGRLHRDIQAHCLVIDGQNRLRIVGLEVAGEAAPGSSPSPASTIIDSQAAHSIPSIRSSGSGGERPVLRPTDELRLQREGAARDLLMCGILLHRLLAGAPALDEPDSALVADRLPPTGRDLLRLPWSTPQPIPEALRAIVNRSTDRQAAHRYFTARSLLRALEGWREDHARADGNALHAMIDRLQAAGSLPARTDLPARVARVLGLGNQHGRAMAGELLMDMGLSFELLRQVNGSQARSSSLAGSEPVLTLRRAIAMVGLSGVQRAATGLRPWPGPLDPAQAQALERTMEQARVAAGTAVRLRPAGYDGEVVYLITLLQNLGRLLVRYHFPDEAAQISQLTMPTPATPTSDAIEGMGEREASYAVLGVDIESMASAVARHWGLGDEVQTMIRRLPADKTPHASGSDAELLRVTASAGNDAVDALLAGDPARVGRQLTRVVQRYGRLLGFGGRELQEALQGARAMVRQGRADTDSDLTQPGVLQGETPAPQD